LVVIALLLSPPVDIAGGTANQCAKAAALEYLADLGRFAAIEHGV
jgi:hypothetical protein